MAKAEVCKTSIHRFKSDRRLVQEPKANSKRQKETTCCLFFLFAVFFLLFSCATAGVAELVDARDLKSLGCAIGRAGSSPALGTVSPSRKLPIKKILNAVTHIQENRKCLITPQQKAQIQNQPNADSQLLKNG